MDDQYFVDNVVRIDAKFTNKPNIKISTGFPINASLIATARHAIYDMDGGKAVKIIVRLSTRNEDTGELAFLDPVEVKELAFEFEPENDIDFIVLRLEKDLKLQAYRQVISSSKVLPSEEWSTWGFPLIGDNYGEKYQSKGGINPLDYNDKYIHLTNEDNALQLDRWKGLSGAPIIVNNWLCGVMVDVSPEMNARFRAISFYWLMKNKPFSTFYHHYVYPLSEEEYKAKEVVKNQLYRLLERTPDIKNHITEYWRLDGACSGDLCVEHLLSISSLDALRGLEKALSECFEYEEQRAWLKLVDCAIDLARWLLLLTVNPEWLAENKMRTGVYEQTEGVESIKLGVPVYGEIVISRWLINLRPIGLDKSNIVRSKGQRGGLGLFACVSKAAAEEELIVPLFRDIQRLPDGEGEKLTVTEMCEQIVMTVNERTAPLDGQEEHRQNPASLCYLLPKEELEKIKKTSWKPNLEHELKGKLVFVGYEKCDSSKASRVDQRTLIAALKELMLMRKCKEPRDV